MRRLYPCVRLWAAAAAGILAAAALAGCGASPASGSDLSITLYNGQHVQTAESMISGFERATGITVNVRNDDEDVLADQIVTEGSGSPADVIWTENSPALEYLQGKGLLAKVDASTLARTPAKYNSPDGDWVGVSARVSVLTYDPKLIARSQLPTSILQLASPRYRGKLAIAPAETDFQPIVTSVMRRYGRARGAALAAGHQGQRGRSRLPRQRDHRRPGEPRGRRVRPDQPVLLVPDARRDRRLPGALADRRASLRAIPATSSTCRAPRS